MGFTRIALFPGQGIRPTDIVDALEDGNPLLDEASASLGFPMKRRVAMTARTPKGKLMTTVAQPAIFVASCVRYGRAIEEGDSFDAFAGHSLGEYAALVAAGAIDFGDALGVVRTRADAMQEAARATPGGMAALMGLSIEECEDIAQRADVEVANDNAPGQVVVAGGETALARAAELAHDAGGRSLLLEVSGPFHSSGMRRASSALQAALDSVEIRVPEAPVMCNVTARPYGSANEIRAMLVAQLSGRVRWRESIEYLFDRGARDFVDLGPGNVVAGLAKKTTRAREPVAHA